MWQVTPAAISLMEGLLQKGGAHSVSRLESRNEDREIAALSHWIRLGFETYLPISEVMKTGKAPLALNPRAAFGFTSAVNSELLPKAKPRAMREHFVVPAIGSRDVVCAEWPDIRRFEHFL